MLCYAVRYKSKSKTPTPYDYPQSPKMRYMQRSSNASLHCTTLCHAEIADT